MSKPYVPAWLAVFDRILIGTALLTGGALLAFMTIFGTINVLVMRKLLNNPVVGTEDLMILALVVVAAISIPFGGRVGAHIEIEVLERFFPRWFDFASRVILRAIGAVLMGVMALQLVEAGHSAVRFGETTQQLCALLLHSGRLCGALRTGAHRRHRSTPHARADRADPAGW